MKRERCGKAEKNNERKYEERTAIQKKRKRS